MVFPAHQGPDGFPLPYRFTVGDGSVIEGLDLAVQRMSKGDILRAVIPPALSYQSTAQGPVPQEVRAAARRRGAPSAAI